MNALPAPAGEQAPKIHYKESSMIDNRENPTKATCIPGCEAVHYNGADRSEAGFCKELVTYGWLWHVEYDQVCTHCPAHPFTGEHPDPGQYD